MSLVRAEDETMFEYFVRVRADLRTQESTVWRSALHEVICDTKNKVLIFVLDDNDTAFDEGKAYVEKTYSPQMVINKSDTTKDHSDFHLACAIDSQGDVNLTQASRARGILILASESGNEALYQLIDDVVVIPSKPAPYYFDPDVLE